MSVARVTEISSQSNRSFEDAIKQGIRRANETLRNVSGAWVKEQQISVTDGRITGYRVNMLITFVLDSGSPVAGTVATKNAGVAASMTKKRPAKKSAKKAAKKAARRR